jgi:uncharacterized RDD family membrane protein YckC
MSRARGRQIVTPEHVEIELVPAGLGNRFLAFTIDLVCVLGASAAVAQLTLVLLPAAVGTLVRAVVFLFLSWGYHAYYEARQQGQSPGKRIVGLRVVDGRGLPLGLDQAFVRNAVRALDALPIGYALGALVCVLDRERRRLGDIAADTLVVRETRAYAFDRRVARERVFNSLRTPRVLRLIRHRVSLEEREFLGTLCFRAEALEPRARFDLMEAVSQLYRAKLEIDDPHLSGENLVRGLTAILFADRPGAGRAGTRA